jgi:hypothetical protein
MLEKPQNIIRALQDNRIAKSFMEMCADLSFVVLVMLMCGLKYEDCAGSYTQ